MPLEVQDVLELGQPSTPVCPGLRRVLGGEAVSTETGKALGRLGRAVRSLKLSAVAPLSTRCALQCSGQSPVNGRSPRRHAGASPEARGTAPRRGLSLLAR